MREQSNSAATSRFDEEYELEMDGFESENNDELETMIEGEADDSEYETDDSEYEASDEFEYESDGFSSNGYAERLYELSQQEFEAADLDAELEAMLDEIEQESFWKRVKRGISKVSKNPALRGVAKGLISKGLKYAQKYVPHADLLKAGTQLMRGNIKGALMPVFRTAVQALAPGVGTAALAAADQLGITSENEAHENIEALNEVIVAAQRAYEYAADNLNESVDHPLGATQLASQSLEVGMNRFKRKQTPRAKQFQPRNMSGNPARPAGTRVVQLHQRPGEKIRKVVILID